MAKKIEQWEGLRGKLHNEALPYRAICFGFDQSYANTGIALVGITNDKEIDILHLESISASWYENNKLEFRKQLTLKICKLMREYRAKADQCFALCESVRVHSSGQLSITNHLSWGALQGCIADCLYQRYGIPLRVVDTRSWKARVVGTSKPAKKAPPRVDPKKWPTIQYVMHVCDVDREDISIKLSKRVRSWSWLDEGEDGPETKYTYDSDKCDACCIAIYGLKQPLNKLKLAP